MIERRSDVEIVAADPDRNVSRIDAATESSTQGDLFDQPVDLNDYVKAIETSPAPTGVPRSPHEHTPALRPQSGVDVYLDDGRYAYAPTIDAIEIEGGALRQWPGSTADVSPPSNDRRRHRQERTGHLPCGARKRRDDDTRRSERGGLATLAASAAHRDRSARHRVEVPCVLAELEGLSVARAQDSGRVTFTLPCPTSAGGERVVLDESGRLIRYERSRSGGPDEVVEFTIERVDSGDLES
ncbi:MAG: hypothetical protein R2710_08045 [Acidimicrobiales bacterium]